MARARFLARRRRSRHWTASAPGSASPRCNSRVMTRTASDNSVLSLGSCIKAAVTVLSSRTVAPLSSRSCLALTNKAWLIASQVSARIAAIVWTLAARNAIDFLATRAKLTPADAYALCSIAVSFRVTQVVDIVRGVHAMIPENLFTGELRQQIAFV